jgi:hypothetical protein
MGSAMIIDKQRYFLFSTSFTSPLIQSPNFFRGTLVQLAKEMGKIFQLIKSDQIRNNVSVAIEIKRQDTQKVRISSLLMEMITKQFLQLIDNVQSMETTLDQMLTSRR